ncbi:hypothetical protein ABY59_0200045 [Enterobacter phage phiEap-2]|jgi:hypothetical protein|uniref:hypothetical protein n=1 Tax=Enterobacter phage phiEap-2 TaxID=1701257 RepID=UPI0006BD76D8|nr:hypothetical protein ABY59_0200045 [Enterobacter phage phiEap-2]ALA45612.1 hypothetical protein ABY59_0200045 [Enterobacter phage phiEap-2]
MIVSDMTKLTDAELVDYLTNYVWYAISADQRLALGEEFMRRNSKNNTEEE